MSASVHGRPAAALTRHPGFASEPISWVQRRQHPSSSRSRRVAAPSTPTLASATVLRQQLEIASRGQQQQRRPAASAIRRGQRGGSLDVLDQG